MKNLNHLAKLLFLVLVFAQNAWSQQLSPQAKVSVITVAPGKELNDVFGHSLLWIYDPVNGIDHAYNWGTYDFRTPNFYGKFVLGRLPYTMEYASLSLYMAYYQKHNRKMTEQVLDLAPAQKQIMFDRLQQTYNDPDKRTYLYKFFTDNCATRIRDAIEVACTDSVHYGIVKGMSDTTFRQWMNKCLYRGKMYWAAVGMNIALGADADERTTQFESNYLPENLYLNLAAAKRMTHGRLRYIVDTENQLFPVQASTEAEPFFFLTPTFFLLAVLIATCYLTYQHWKKRQKGYTIDKILFSVAGFIGWVLLFLWFCTDHGVTTKNYNILWALPFHLPLIFRLREKTNETWYVYYFIITGVFTALSLVFVAQYMIELVLFVSALLVRAMYHAAFEKENRMTVTKFRKVIKGRKMHVVNYEDEQP